MAKGRFRLGADISLNAGSPLIISAFTSVGYRLFDVDYKNDSFVYDVKQEGWLLGLVWVFGTR